MSEIIKFCSSYWKELIAVGLWLISFIVLLCKKKPKSVSDVLSIVLAAVPKFIKLAEEEIGSGNGSAKKDLVLESCYNMISSYCSLSKEEIIKRYETVLNSAIEDILAAPVKKGN